MGQFGRKLRGGDGIFNLGGHGRREKGGDKGLCRRLSKVVDDCRIMEEGEREEIGLCVEDCGRLSMIVEPWKRGKGGDRGLC